MGFITLALLVIALLLFLFAAFNPTARIQFGWLGLAAWVLTQILASGARL